MVAATPLGWQENQNRGSWQWCFWVTPCFQIGFLLEQTHFMRRGRSYLEWVILPLPADVELRRGFATLAQAQEAVLARFGGMDEVVRHRIIYDSHHGANTMPWLPGVQSNAQVLALKKWLRLRGQAPACVQCSSRVPDHP